MKGCASLRLHAHTLPYLHVDQHQETSVKTHNLLCRNCTMHAKTERLQQIIALCNIFCQLGESSCMLLRLQSFTMWMHCKNVPVHTTTQRSGKTVGNHGAACSKSTGIISGQSLRSKANLELLSKSAVLRSLIGKYVAICTYKVVFHSQPCSRSGYGMLSVAWTAIPISRCMHVSILWEN